MFNFVLCGGWVCSFLQEPVSGLADIKAKIEHLGLGGATVDLGCGSVDAQPSEGGAFMCCCRQICD